jgi:hypothetical protein
MNRLLAVALGLALSLVEVPSVMATTSIGFGSGSVPWTQEHPGHLDVTTNAVGDLTISGSFSGKGATVTVTGPASCSYSSKHGPNKFLGCFIANAPVGDYSITVSPQGKYGILFQGTVTGELVITEP